MLLKQLTTIRLLDISNPAQAKLVSSFNEDQHVDLTGAIVRNGDYAYVFNFSGHLFLLDMTDPLQISAQDLGQLNVNPYSQLQVAGNVLYASSSGLQTGEGQIYAFDVSMPTNPTELEHIVSPCLSCTTTANVPRKGNHKGATHKCASCDYMLYLSGPRGLRAYSVYLLDLLHDPDRLVISSLDFDDIEIGNQLVRNGDYAYYFGYGDVAWAIDMKEPTKLVANVFAPWGQFDDSSNFQVVQGKLCVLHESSHFAGGYEYRSGIYVFELHDPTMPNAVADIPWQTIKLEP